MTVQEGKTESIDQAIAEKRWDDVDELFLGMISSGAVDYHKVLGTADKIEKAGQSVKAGGLLVLYISDARKNLSGDEVFRAVKRAIALAPRDKELPALLRSAIRKAHQRPDIDVILEKADVSGKGDIRSQLARAEELLQWKEGDHVLHESGFGIGQIVATDVVEERLIIDFEFKKGHSFSYAMAGKALSKLDPNGVAVLSRVDSDKLANLLETDPAVVVRATLRDNHGKISTKELKIILTDAEQPRLSTWNAWWKKTKAALTNDPWVEISKGNVPTLVLRDQPLEIHDEVRMNFEKLPTFHHKFKEAYHIFDSLQAAGHKTDNLSYIQSYFQQVIDSAQIKKLSDAKEYIESALLLEDEFSFDPGSASLKPEDAALKFSLRDLLPLIIRNDHAKRLLTRIRKNKTDWSTIWEKAWFGGSRETWEMMYKVWSESADSAPLARIGASIWETHREHPEAFLFWAQKYFDGDEKLCAPGTKVLAVFERLTRTLDHYFKERDRKKDRFQDRKYEDGVIQDYRTFISAGQFRHVAEFVSRALESGQREDVKYLEALLMGCSGFSDQQRSTVRRVLPHMDIERKIAGDDDTIFCTDEGYKKMQAKLHRLVTELIPDVERRIGEAQEKGDLSENSEWEAALEEKVNLDAERARIEVEFTKVKLVHFDDVHTDHIDVGTRFVLEDVESGKSEFYTLIGPWDSDAEKRIISPFTPIGKAAKNKKLGEIFSAELPGGTATYKVLSIENAGLEN
ncbi:MAG: GreA/GreB family elongation factor [Planctomycetes bacterium]|nr:GreA/GreB family elongation factor [Planctomycetota bacterium]